MQCFARDREERMNNVANFAGALLEAVDAPFAGQVRRRSRPFSTRRARRLLDHDLERRASALTGNYRSLSLTGSGPRLSSSGALRVAIDAANGPTSVGDRRWGRSVGGSGGAPKETPREEEGRRHQRRPRRGGRDLAPSPAGQHAHPPPAPAPLVTAAPAQQPPAPPQTAATPPAPPPADHAPPLRPLRASAAASAAPSAAQAHGVGTATTAVAQPRRVRRPLRRPPPPRRPLPLPPPRPLLRPRPPTTKANPLEDRQ